MSVGHELLINPSIILLDEPTSGVQILLVSFIDADLTLHFATWQQRCLLYLSATHMHYATVWCQVVRVTCAFWGNDEAQPCAHHFPAVQGISGMTPLLVWRNWIT